MQRKNTTKQKQKLKEQMPKKKNANKKIEKFRLGEAVGDWYYRLF